MMEEKAQQEEQSKFANRDSELAKFCPLMKEPVIEQGVVFLIDRPTVPASPSAKM
jgi:hypothetical protein